MATDSVQVSAREQQILDATLALVASEGLLNASISKISKRAKSSPGIVYHYFDSKDGIMDRLFINIFREMTTYIMDDTVLSLPVLERYMGLWLRKYHYHFNNPAQTIFLEEYKNSAYYTAEQQQRSQQFMMELAKMGQSDIENGLVIELSIDDLYTMTMTVALNLAKAHVATQRSMNIAELETIAERVCRSVLV